MKHKKIIIYSRNTLVFGVDKIAIGSDFTFLTKEALHIPKLCHGHPKLVEKERWLVSQCTDKRFSPWFSVQLFICG